MIKVVNVWKRFGEKIVLKGMNLSVHDGETLVILGRSGVGKSVLLKHIMGIATPDRGYIEVDGVRITELSAEKRYDSLRNMGMLFQSSALFDSMNVKENVAFYLRHHGNLKTGRAYTPKEMTDLVERALEMVDLPEVQEKMPAQLSGGMRKRVALARLIVYSPQYLLYDEPTTGLDPITAMQINELIVKIQEELKATSIVVTHDIVSSLFVGDRLALHKDGVIAYIDQPDRFLQIDDPIIDFLRKTITEDPRSLRKERESHL